MRVGLPVAIFDLSAGFVRRNRDAEFELLMMNLFAIPSKGALFELYTTACYTYDLIEETFKILNFGAIPCKFHHFL